MFSWRIDFYERISIHALREESDEYDEMHVLYGEDFNPRSP